MNRIRGILPGVNIGGSRPGSKAGRAIKIGGRSEGGVRIGDLRIGGRAPEKPKAGRTIKIAGGGSTVRVGKLEFPGPKKRK